MGLRLSSGRGRHIAAPLFEIRNRCYGRFTFWGLVAPTAWRVPLSAWPLSLGSRMASRSPMIEGAWGLSPQASLRQQDPCAPTGVLTYTCGALGSLSASPAYTLLAALVPALTLLWIRESEDDTSLVYIVFFLVNVCSLCKNLSVKKKKKNYPQFPFRNPENLPLDQNKDTCKLLGGTSIEWIAVPGLQSS